MNHMMVLKYLKEVAQEEHRWHQATKRCAVVRAVAIPHTPPRCKHTSASPLIKVDGCDRDGGTKTQQLTEMMILKEEVTQAKPTSPERAFFMQSGIMTPEELLNFHGSVQAVKASLARARVDAQIALVPEI